MSCVKGITANIINDCDYQPKGGVEETVYAFNRSDIDTITYNATNKHIVEDITLASGKLAYTIKGFKKSSNAGYDMTVNENLPDTFKQYFSFQPWGNDAATVKALDNLSDLVIVTESKNKGVSGNGAFEIFGLETGLYKSSDSKRANDNNGIPTIEMTTQDGEDASVSRHILFDTDYATTKAILVGLLT